MTPGSLVRAGRKEELPEDLRKHHEEEEEVEGEEELERRVRLIEVVGIWAEPGGAYKGWEGKCGVSACI